MFASEDETVTQDVDVREEFEIVVGILIVVPSAMLVSVSDEPSMNVDVCEKSEIDVDTSVAADFDSLRD